MSQTLRRNRTKKGHWDCEDEKKGEEKRIVKEVPKANEGLRKVQERCQNGGRKKVGEYANVNL
jgi:hypothetical protein